MAEVTVKVIEVIDDTGYPMFIKCEPTWDLSAMLSKHCAKLVHSESTMQPQIAPTKQAMSNNLKEKRTKIL